MLWAYQLIYWAAVTDFWLGKKPLSHPLKVGNVVNFAAYKRLTQERTDES
jgi:hypothetical protein